MKKLLVSISFVFLAFTLASCGESQWKKNYDATIQKQRQARLDNQQNIINQVTDQLKPYNIKDLSNLGSVIFESTNRSLGSDKVICSQDTISSLSAFAYCASAGNDTSKYVLVNNRDADFWTILQVIPKEGILVRYEEDSDAPDTVILIEGKFPNATDGQDFSNRHYLLKHIGTFTYNNTAGSTSTINKFKLITQLNISDTD